MLKFDNVQYRKSSVTYHKKGGIGSAVATIYKADYGCCDASNGDQGQKTRWIPGHCRVQGCNSNQVYSRDGPGQKLEVNMGLSHLVP